MEPATAKIPARSHRQAMEWSLVLVSQGIECLIERDGEGEAWELVVPAQDFSRARQSIDLYRAENRHWHWRQELFRPGLVFDWISLFWLALLLMFFWLGTSRPGFQLAGVLDTAALSHGQWWRLFTAVWLHADAAHLASNAGIGLVLLGLTMGRYGTGIGLLAAYLAGVGGNLMDWMLAPSPRESLGASGLVMGCLGLLAVQSVRLWRNSPQTRKLLVTAVFAGIMLFIFLGLNPGSDLLAHAGGFLSGLVLAGVFAPFPGLRQAGKANLLAGCTFALLVVLPWWMALPHPRR
jgi:membrane associated rhomboid family serine protease